MGALRTILAGKTVGIAGCGGLGSNCAAALVRCGVGRLILVDFDVVSDGNLNRQFYFRDQVGRKKVEALAENLRRIDPGVNLELSEVRLDPERIATIFADCDLIVEAFDAADQKEMLLETVLTRFPGKFLVAASGLAGYGHVDEIVSRRSGKLVMVGDFHTEISEWCPPLAPRVGVAAAKQADWALTLLLEDPEAEKTP